MVDAEVFSFEDRDGEFNVFDFLGCANNGLYYEPPVNLLDLERLLKRGVHHASALRAKINRPLAKIFIPSH